MKRDPVSSKVSVGTLGGGALATITWALTTFVPAWHNGIPTQLQTFIPALLGIIGYFGAGYAAKHSATVSEIGTALQDAEKVIGLFEAPQIAHLVPSSVDENQVARAMADWLASHPKATQTAQVSPQPQTSAANVVVEPGGGDAVRQ